MSDKPLTIRVANKVYSFDPAMPQITLQETDGEGNIWMVHYEADACLHWAGSFTYYTGSEVRRHLYVRACDVWFNPLAKINKLLLKQWKAAPLFTRFMRWMRREYNC